MNALHVYTLLHEACRMLDEEGDHAIAAYVGLGMSLVEEKYHVGQEDLEDVELPPDASPLPASSPTHGRTLS